MRVVFMDCECLSSPEGEGYSWDEPWKLGLAVAATTEKDVGGKQWLAEDAIDLVNDFALADCVVGFNCIRFDLPLIDGEAHHQGRGEYDVTPGGGLSRALIVDDETVIVDMLLDVWDAIGKRVKGTGLKPLSVHTLGKEPGMEGALAPVAWADKRKLEVISYCADDVEWSRELFNHALKHGWLKRPKNSEHPLDPQKGHIQFDVTWNIRHAAGGVIMPFRAWYDAAVQREKEGGK
tara:strand:+ start:239 stop:943 length:705 start_codon:yes stop_codon:yes gene_type:complete